MGTSTPGVDNGECEGEDVEVGGSELMVDIRCRDCCTKVIAFKQNVDIVWIRVRRVTIIYCMR